MVHALSPDPAGLSKLLHTGPPRYLGGISNLRTGLVRTLIATPEPLDSTLGNSITAHRWTKLLAALGHEVSITKDWQGQDCDVLIALHARRSHAAAQRFRQLHPQKPLIIALTGTDLYRDLPVSAEARLSLSLATRIIALQEAALDELDEENRSKTSVIYQSAEPPARRSPQLQDCFEICVLSHLRDVKDPMRAAYASRLLPSQSRIRVVHAGRALEAKWEAAARAEENANPRYRWIGEQPHEEAMQLLARSRLLVLSSIMEGGASAIAEAAVCNVAVLCSDIKGNIGMLGPGYPGYFRLKQTEQLANLLGRAETDRHFLADLRQYIENLRSRFDPEQEMASWDRVLRQL
jgi:putative glycosyltransferase (TIGR04348 family)